MRRLGSDVYAHIKAERARQDAQWGGTAHDDTHDPAEWVKFLDKQLTAADALTPTVQAGEDEAYRERLVKIAALAVAAIESHDRLKRKRRAERLA